jgi:hypothetical protein
MGGVSKNKELNLDDKIFLQGHMLSSAGDALRDSKDTFQPA